MNGSGNKTRSGAQTLILLAAPINFLILRSLAEGPRQQTELRRATESPPQTTLRAQLRHLAEIGALEKRRRNRFPGVLEYELTATGRDLLFAAQVLERWLKLAPDGPLQLGDNAAKAAIKALAEGWSTTMLRALAARPLSLTELDSVISSLSYPSLERRLSALRLAQLVKSQPGNGRGTPYTATDWLRYGIAPIAAAARWERCHRPQSTAPIGGLDVETALLLAIPLLRLPSELSGSCRLAAEVSNGSRRLAGATVEIAAGEVASCSTKLQGSPNAWALGSISAWLSAMLEHDLDRLELGGDGKLVRALIGDLRSAFAVPVQSY